MLTCRAETGLRPGIMPCVIKPAAIYAAATDRFHSPLCRQALKNNHKIRVRIITIQAR